MNPDKVANNVKEYLESIGYCLNSLEFQSKEGHYSYSTIVQEFLDGSTPYCSITHGYKA